MKNFIIIQYKLYLKNNDTLLIYHIFKAKTSKTLQIDKKMIFTIKKIIFFALTPLKEIK